MITVNYDYDKWYVNNTLRRSTASYFIENRDSNTISTEYIHPHLDCKASAFCCDLGHHCQELLFLQLVAGGDFLFWCLCTFDQVRQGLYHKYVAKRRTRSHEVLKLFVEKILQAWWWCSLANFQCMSLHVHIAMACQNMAKRSTNETNIESPLLQVHPSKAVNERAGRPFVHDQNFAPCPTRFRKQLMTLRKTFGKMHQKIAIAISTNLPPFTPSHRPQNLPKSTG